MNSSRTILLPSWSLSRNRIAWMSPLVCALIILLALTLSGCGGGGGGGDSGGGRSTTTGVRVIHASVDESPVTVFVDEVAVQNKSYLELADFVAVAPGTRAFSVRRSNSVSENLLSLSQPFSENTEYTVFVWGEALKGDRRVSILPEEIIRPEAGRARLRFVNGYSGEDRYRLRCGSHTSEFVRQGNVTEYLEIEALPLDCEVLSSSGGRVLATSFTPSDRGDVSVLFAGSDDLNVRFVRVFTDLD